MESDLSERYLQFLISLGRMKNDEISAVLDLTRKSSIAGEVDDLLISSRDAGFEFIEQILSRTQSEHTYWAIAILPVSSYLERFGSLELSRLEKINTFERVKKYLNS